MLSSSVYQTRGRNRIFEHAVVGGEPQDVKFRGERSYLEIGDDNLIREFCTLHRASGEGETTRIGSRNFSWSAAVAHNCVIGDDNIFANEVALAGHIVVEDHVFISNNVGAHQFVRLAGMRWLAGSRRSCRMCCRFLRPTEIRRACVG